MKEKSAVLILEGPWNIYDGDINRSSVEPFFEGMAKQFDNVEILHSRFYDVHSFRLAFAALIEHNYQNAIVYVAGHGDGHRVGGAKIIDILVECSVDSVRANITGVLLGSCFSAGTAKNSQADVINAMIQESNIAWVAAYDCRAYWQASTMVDMSIISTMLHAEEEDFQTRESINHLLAQGIECFSPTFVLGDNGDEEEPVSMAEGISFFTQPRGQGHRAKCVTLDVWDEWVELQVNYEEELED
jgi:hypothetical protein